METGGVTHILAQQDLLVVDDLLQCLKLLLLRGISLHRTVMDASHADREEFVVCRTNLLQTLFPVLLHRHAVGLVVETSPLCCIPLTDIVSEQWLTVRSTDDNATGVGHILCTGNLEERCRPLMHGGPDGVCTQSQQ